MNIDNYIFFKKNDINYAKQKVGKIIFSALLIPSKCLFKSQHLVYVDMGKRFATLLYVSNSIMVFVNAIYCCYYSYAS